MAESFRIASILPHLRLPWVVQHGRPAGTRRPLLLLQQPLNSHRPAIRHQVILHILKRSSVPAWPDLRTGTACRHQLRERTRPTVRWPSTTGRWSPCRSKTPPSPHAKPKPPKPTGSSGTDIAAPASDPAGTHPLSTQTAPAATRRAVIRDRLAEIVAPTLHSGNPLPIKCYSRNPSHLLSI